MSDISAGNENMVSWLFDHLALSSHRRHCCNFFIIHKKIYLNILYTNLKKRSVTLNAGDIL